jgi:hypothetical protein
MSSHLLYEVFQFLTVAVLVTGCALYCLLTLAPNVVKQALTQALLHCPLPAFIATKLRQPAANSACGSNCGACSAGPATPQAVKWHPRKP